MSDYFEKSQAARLDFEFDWSDWLGPRDAIEVASFTVDAGVTVESQSHNGRTATVWLSGGEMYDCYGVRCSIRTQGGRTDHRTAMMTIKELSTSSASRVYKIPRDPDVYG